MKNIAIMLENIIQQENINAIKSILDSGDLFVVMAHKNPDGDAVGSSLALCGYIQRGTSI